MLHACTPLSPIDRVSIWKSFWMSINTSIYVLPLRYRAKMYVSYIIAVFFLFPALFYGSVFLLSSSIRDVLHYEIVNQINNLFHSYMEDVALFLKNKIYPEATSGNAMFGCQPRRFQTLWKERTEK